MQSNHPRHQSKMDTKSSGRRFDVKFVTKQEEFSVADTVFQISGSSSTNELNQLINSILEEGTGESPHAEFDFLVENELLRLSLEDHLEEICTARGEFMNAERQVIIEYLFRQAAPKPDNTLLHDDWVSAVDTNHKYVVSGCYDGVISIWSLMGKHEMAQSSHSNPVKGVKWIDSSKVPNVESLMDDDEEYLFASASHDETLKIWKYSSSDKKIECLYVCKGHTRSVDCLAINCDLLASGSFDKLLKIWSLDSNKNEDMDSDDEAGTSSKTIGRKKKKRKSDGQSSKNKAPVPSKETKTPILTLSGHSEAITGVTWFTDPKVNMAAPEVATCSMDNTIRIWDIEVSQVKQTLVGSKAFLSLSYNASSNLIITGSSDRFIRLWDPRCPDGQMVQKTFTSHNGWVSSVDWSPVNDNHFVSGSYDAVVKLWDTRSPKTCLYDLMGHKDKVLCVNWTNPEIISSGGADNQVKLFKTSISQWVTRRLFRTPCCESLPKKMSQGNKEDAEEICSDLKLLDINEYDEKQTVGNETDKRENDVRQPEDETQDTIDEKINDDQRLAEYDFDGDEEFTSYDFVNNDDDVEEFWLIDKEAGRVYVDENMAKELKENVDKMRQHKTVIKNPKLNDSPKSFYDDPFGYYLS